jgi:hypothetical protein
MCLHLILLAFYVIATDLAALEVHPVKLLALKVPAPHKIIHEMLARKVPAPYKIIHEMLVLKVPAPNATARYVYVPDIAALDVHPWTLPALPTRYVLAPVMTAQVVQSPDVLVHCELTPTDLI